MLCTESRMTCQWIDEVAGVAYLRVDGPALPMDKFLGLLDGLLVHPKWRRGMPVIQDIRGLTSTPPVSCVIDWSDYLLARGPMLHGCRIAVVARGDDPVLDSVVEECGAVSGSEYISVAMFRDMSAAHQWALGPGRLAH